MLYRSILRPALFRLEPETAHKLGLRALRAALGTKAARNAMSRHFMREPFGALERFGLTFRNPIGVAAGFDKNGEVAAPLAALGFGCVEVGTVTHQAQPGNPRPRLFRLPLDHALINRQGFNNHGAAALAARRSRSARPDCVLGINIGKSRAVAVQDALPDYLASFDLVSPHADYVVVNVSSPNTPHLRELQQADALDALLGALQRRNREQAALTGHPVPLLVKVAPDLQSGELELIVEVADRHDLAGIVATNTTVARDELLRTPAALVTRYGAGGLSGAPLRARSTDVIRSLYRLARGTSLVVIGVGGIFSADDAWAKICAGASLVQLYTGFVYQGIAIARDLNDGLAERLRRDGFRSFDEAVGCKA